MYGVEKGVEMLGDRMMLMMMMIITVLSRFVMTTMATVGLMQPI
jgi:hypothetical protein